MPDFSRGFHSVTLVYTHTSNFFTAVKKTKKKKYVIILYVALPVVYTRSGNRVMMEMQLTVAFYKSRLETTAKPVWSYSIMKSLDISETTIL